MFASSIVMVIDVVKTGAHVSALNTTPNVQLFDPDAREAIATTVEMAGRHKGHRQLNRGRSLPADCG
ncbi:MAG: hypothetical protein RBS10_01855 [Thauera propionica]|jgi:hypothetical protein|uniref:Uncharacterized protein n=1 Tax=Thauera terpenica 58Eu TaxID=1348657 RepID=T0AQI5_9RHOO|nr:hypothetical protein [Thauera terpenica]EPZ15049.1 hypothetical protein M622_16930 [Thauera terpenica 58Eu]MDY0046140.1 hypothetical protein [Thauera propionica]